MTATPMFDRYNSAAVGADLDAMNAIADAVRATRPEDVSEVIFDMWTRDAIFGEFHSTLNAEATLAYALDYTARGVAVARRHEARRAGEGR